MRSHVLSVVLSVILVAAAVMPVFAGEEETAAAVEAYATKEFELQVKLSPYALQVINYKAEYTPQQRTSSYGAGGLVGFYWNFAPAFAVGADVSYEYHNVTDFHKYNDIKADARFRWRFVSTEDNRFRAFVLLGAGGDYVIRDDYDKGFYPLFVGGLSAEYMLSENFSLSAGADAGLTLQKESNVFNLTTFIGGSYHFGGSK